MLKPIKISGKLEISDLTFQVINNKGINQSVQMCSLVCAINVHMHQSQGFSS